MAQPLTPQAQFPELVRDLQAHLTWVRETDPSDFPKRAPGAARLAVSRPAPAPEPSPTQPRGPAAVAAPAAPAGATAEIPAGASLQVIREEIGDCKRCRLHEGRTNIVFGVGNPKAELCFVGEGPGADEDAKGEPFVGRAGQLLDKMIEAMGFRREDVYICNVVKCRPPANRAPEPDEMATCSPFLRAQLRAVQPKVIVVLGKTAAQALLDDRTPITRLRGRWREYQGIALMPTFHPAYLLRSPGEKSKAWEDLKAVVKRLGRELPGATELKAVGWVHSDPYGLTRVVGQSGTLPQQAQRLDPCLPLREDELLIDVDTLNVDAASFRQLERETGGSPEAMIAAVQKIVQQRGKLQNPVTGSGGMLLGTVRQVGPRHPVASTLRPGTRVATLVSLTLTPLELTEILGIDARADRVRVRGHAILFATGLFAEIPSDLPEGLVLGALDVCGAPALTARHVRPGARVLVIGAGKSGALCCAQAKRSGAAQVLAYDVSQVAVEELAQLGYAEPLAGDATHGLEVFAAVERATGGALCDLVINVSSVSGTEMGALLSVREGGTVLFFSMATSFAQAALGAEGIGKDATLLIGNGYARGHAELALQLLRDEPKLRALLERRLG